MIKLLVLAASAWVLILNNKNSDEKDEEEVFEREFNDYTTKIKPSDRIVDKKFFNQPQKIEKKKCSKNNLNKVNKKTSKSKKTEDLKSVESKQVDKMLFKSDKGDTLIISNDNFDSFVESQKTIEELRPKNYEQNANIWYSKNLDFINVCIAEAYSRNRHALISEELLPEKESWPYIANKIVNNSSDIKVSVNHNGLLINVEK